MSTEQSLVAALRGWLPVDEALTPPFGDQPSAVGEAALLVDDELSAAGEHAEGLVAELAQVLRPGGLVAATARNAVYAEASGAPLDGLRAFSPADFERLFTQRGFAIELLAAPGAASRLRQTTPGSDLWIDLARDRHPALLGAASGLLIVARAPRDPDERSRRFFAALPRKVVAAAVLCRTADGQVLTVHDTFKRTWTIPGGVVDADEDPRSAALRETWEEAGVRARAGALLGVFSASWPDRLVFVYAADPTGESFPEPPHAHEIDAVAWVEVEEALRRVSPWTRFQLERCLDEPGGTWRQ
ncbi:MAG: NUDIX hydrolase [Egibacteraceae bacterium]